MEEHMSQQDAHLAQNNSLQAEHIRKRDRRNAHLAKHTSRRAEQNPTGRTHYLTIRTDHLKRHK